MIEPCFLILHIEEGAYLLDVTVFDDLNPTGYQRHSRVLESPKGVRIGCEERNSLECFTVELATFLFGIVENLPEFHNGEAANARPIPMTSSSTFRLAELSSIGANSFEKSATWELIDPRDLSRASYVFQFS